jgi:hypothetical protein
MGGIELWIDVDGDRGVSVCDGHVAERASARAQFKGVAWHFV